MIKLISAYLLLCFAFPLPAQTGKGSHDESVDKELSSFSDALAAQVRKSAIKRITVLDLTDLQGNTPMLGAFIAEETTVNLVSSTNTFAVVDRAHLNKILAEHKLTVSGLIQPENAKKLGQLSGVDAIVLGVMTPLKDTIKFTAKIISTENAEILGAAKGQITKTPEVEKLLQLNDSEPPGSGEKKAESKQEKTTDRDKSPGSVPAPVPPKPFGDLEVKIESLKYVPGLQNYGTLRLTLILTNTSPNMSYGVAVDGSFYKDFHITNDQGDEFFADEVAGIGTSFISNGGGFVPPPLTELPPRNGLTITAKSYVRFNGKPGDYPPYRLQTVILFAIENKGRYPDVKKYNLVLDVK